MQVNYQQKIQTGYIVTPTITSKFQRRIQEGWARQVENLTTHEDFSYHGTNLGDHRPLSSEDSEYEFSIGISKGFETSLQHDGVESHFSNGSVLARANSSNNCPNNSAPTLASQETFYKLYNSVDGHHSLSTLPSAYSWPDRKCIASQHAISDLLLGVGQNPLVLISPDSIPTISLAEARIRLCHESLLGN